MVRRGVRSAFAGLLAGVLAVPLAVLGMVGLAGVTASSARADLRPRLAQVQRQIDALNHQAEQAGERYNTARVELTETTRRLRAVRQRLERQRRSYDAVRVLVGRIAASAYRSGSVDPTVVLLLSEDPTAYLRQSVDLTVLGEHQAKVLREMATARLRLTQDRRSVREQQARAAGLQRTLGAEKRTLRARLAAARRVLGSLKAAQRARLEQQRQAAQQRAVASRADAPRASRGSRDGPTSDDPTSDGPASGGQAADGPAADGPAGGQPSGRAAIAVKTAYAQLGDPYVWAGVGPNSFDCSGLTMYAWAAAGVSLPHSSAAQYSAVRRIAVGDLQPGDLVFYYSPISHVAMYIGGGKVIDAPYPGKSVHIAGLYSMPLVGAGRP